MPDDEARLPKKSARRVQIVKAIADGLASERVFGPLTSATLTEKELKLYMHSPLVDAVAALLRTLYPGQQETTYRKRADEAVYWEGDARTVINNIEFMGVQHRPDFVVALPREDLSVAVEVKWGESGGDIRAGIGQSVVYATCGRYAFVVFVFKDTSRDQKIKQAVERGRDRVLIERLWEHFNVRFVVV